MADTIVPDPADPQSWNRYSYVRNNPVNRVDPTGHADWTLAVSRDFHNEVLASGDNWSQFVGGIHGAFRRTFGDEHSFSVKIFDSASELENIATHTDGLIPLIHGNPGSMMLDDVREITNGQYNRLMKRAHEAGGVKIVAHFDCHAGAGRVLMDSWNGIESAGVYGLHVSSRSSFRRIFEATKNQMDEVHRVKLKRLWVRAGETLDDVLARAPRQHWIRTTGNVRGGVVGFALVFGMGLLSGASATESLDDATNSLFEMPFSGQLGDGTLENTSSGGPAYVPLMIGNQGMSFTVYNQPYAGQRVIVNNNTGDSY